MELLKKETEDHFASAAAYYGDLFHGQTPLSHLFSTRLQLVCEMLDGIPTDSVLDAGCGPGMIAPYLVGQNKSYFGLDLTMEMLVDHRDRIGHSNLDYLIVGDMEELPFSDETFDVVLCLGGLEYLTDLHQAIQEESRVVKENGYVIISMQNKWSPYRLWDLHLYHGRTLNLFRKLLGKHVSEERLETIFAQSYLTELLAQNFLETLDIIYYDFNLWLSPLDRYFGAPAAYTARQLEFLRRSFLKRLGTGFIIKAQKQPSS